MKELFELVQSTLEEVRVLKKEVKYVKASRVDDFKDTWVDGQEVLQMLHISGRTLQRLRDNDIMPFSRINGKYYYKIADVENVLDKNYSLNKRANCPRKQNNKTGNYGCRCK